MKFSLQNLKLYIFQEDYSKYNSLLGRCHNHIQRLYKSNVIGINDRNLRLSNLYEIIRKININRDEHESCILFDDNIDIDDTESCESASETEKSDELFDIKNVIYDIIPLEQLRDLEQTENGIYSLLYQYLLNIYKLPQSTHKLLPNNVHYLLNEKILYPLQFVDQEIKQLILSIGLFSLEDIINFYKLESELEDLSESEQRNLNIFNKLIIPLSVSELDKFLITTADMASINSNKEFYSDKMFIRKNTESQKEELLDNNYILFINLSDRWFKIECTFELDALQIDSRLMINTEYEYIYIRKKEIDKMIPENMKFKKKYLKYCSVHELITIPKDDFCKYLTDKQVKYDKINNKPFPSLMKDFIGKTMDLLNWFETIKLLLLGSDENINVAGSLFSLLKDKKTNISLVPDIIYDNLVFCNQMKLKKINQTLKIELDKLSELNYESIDFKKELARSTQIPTYVRALAMEKYNEMKLNNNDYNKQLTYVKTVLSFPWNNDDDNNKFHRYNTNRADAKNFLKEVDIKLNKTTYGHKKLKEQISLLITKWISNPNSSGSAIGLLGPPGVGKTLIAKSLSKALDIPMVMITLGGQNDSELLIGHGYTYSGAQPGMIIKKMCEAGKSRCIMYFDELDKSCAKHGSVNEITSILIHLTDPNTNKAFQDRFFQGIDFPLDKVIFIASYNDSNKIDPILLDRLIELEAKPYNIEDKINILTDHIIPELKENIGIKKDINYNKDDLKKFIYEFTSESGVRDLKHKMEQVLLNINKDIIMSDKEPENIVLTYNSIVEFLGEKNKNKRKMVPTENRIGYINGLYATASGGGGITSIEICPFKTGDGFKIKTTGSMGDVMKESIEVAFTRACTFISENVSLKNITKDDSSITNISEYIKKNFPFGFHVHAPEGATPKDGPSAGAAFTIGFISVILNIPAIRTVAMTGEMNLGGSVTAIGGLIYKLIGAKYAGVKLALVPRDNETDMREILENNSDLFDDEFKYVYVDNMHDVVSNTLVDNDLIKHIKKQKTIDESN